MIWRKVDRRVFHAQPAYRSREIAGGLCRKELASCCLPEAVESIQPPDQLVSTRAVLIGAACARRHHNTLQIDDFHYGHRAGAIASIGQRHLEAELDVPKRLGRVDVVKEVPDRHAEPPLAEVAPDAMGSALVSAEPLTSGQCPFPCLDSRYGSLSPLRKWGRVPWNSPVNVKNLGAPEESRNTSPRVAVN